MQFGPMTEDQALEEDQKKKEALRSYLTTKYNAPAPAQEEAPSNENQRVLADLVSNLGSAFEDFGRAGSVARGGARNDGSFYKNVTGTMNAKFDRDEKKIKEEQAKKRQAIEDQWTGDVRTRQQQEWKDEDSDRATKTADLKAEKDPASQQSLMAQELAKKLMPSKDFAGMSAYQLKSSIPTLEKLYTMEENNKAKLEAARLAAAERAEARSLAQMSRQDQRDIKAQEKQDKEVTRLSDTYEKTGIPAAVAAVDRVHKFLPKDGDVPGYGRVSGMLPDMFVSQDGEDLRQAVQTLFNIELKDRSGAAVTDQELNRLRKEFGQGTWKSDEQLRKGIEQYEARLKEVTRNIMAGAKAETKQEYIDRGGRDFENAIGLKSEEKTKQRTPEDERALQWAQNNPDDPRAKQIIERNK